MSEYRIFHIIKGNLVEIPSAIFADGDTYIVDAPEEKILYIWIGNKSTIDERFAAAQISQTELKETHEDYKVITIEQGNETTEFLELFGDKIKFVKGDVHGLLKKRPKK